jgi:hypothetical protein
MQGAGPADVLLCFITQQIRRPVNAYESFREKEDTMANFLFTLSRDDHEAAARCFQFAKIAHSKGHHVDVFLFESGVMWADSSRDFTVKTVTGDCPHDYLPYLVENQVPIGV